jgi:hypothetical protein
VSEACIHCGRVSGLIAVVNGAGERFWLCEDGIYCSRRKMAADGVKLQLHPKNPPKLRLVKDE